MKTVEFAFEIIWPLVILKTSSEHIDVLRLLTPTILLNLKVLITVN